MDDSECPAEFRVHKRDIPALANNLRIPDNFYCQQRSVSDRIKWLCMLIRQLSYSCRYGDIWNGGMALWIEKWLFGDITNSFKFVDFKKNLKICLSSVGKMYIVCAILHNALTCLYGNQTSSYFDLNEFLVSKETVVLRRWERSKQKFGFIKKTSW